jgi:hypothetical protein
MKISRGMLVPEIAGGIVEGRRGRRLLRAARAREDRWRDELANKHTARVRHARKTALGGDLAASS